MKRQLLLLVSGLSDSVQVYKAINRYSGSEYKPTEETNSIINNLYQLLQFSIKQLLSVYVIEILIDFFGLVILKIIAYPLIILYFIENNVRSLIHISQITSNVQKFESDQQNRQYLIRQLQQARPGSGLANIIQDLKLTMQALIFSMILLIQTSILDILVLVVPDESILKFVLLNLDFIFYAVYISVGYYSLKTPYSEDFPYFLHIYFGYWVGYSLILSYFLNLMFTFPKLGIVFSIFQPYFLIRCFQIDPPERGQFDNVTLKEGVLMIWEDILGNKELDRSSYEVHLRAFNAQQNDYRKEARKSIGWFTIAKNIRPLIIEPLSKLFQTFMRIYYSIMS
ncbi:hypothetical protein pb186bvf_010337 [Paramecium bursaria]